VKSLVFDYLLVESDPRLVPVVFARYAFVAEVRISLDIANFSLACTADIDIADYECRVIRSSFHEYPTPRQRCSSYVSKVRVSDSRISKHYDGTDISLFHLHIEIFDQEDALVIPGENSIL